MITLVNRWLLVSAVLIGTPAWAADSKTTPTPTVSLTQAVHFMDAKGQDLVVGPGEFRVEAAGKSGLKLTPADGKEPIIIEGQVGSVQAPVAVSVPVSEQEHHLVLLLPKGKVVEVVGSPSGVRSRFGGWTGVILSQQQSPKVRREAFKDVTDILTMKPAPHIPEPYKPK